MTDTPLDNILSGREPASEQTAVETVAQAVEGESQQQPQTEAETGEGEAQTRMVPHEALHAEKQKVKRYTEQVASFEQTIKERDAAWERRLAQILDTVKPKEVQQPPDQFDDFQGATRHAVKPEIDGVRQALMANAQMIAGLKFGDDVVNEAEQAFENAYKAGQLDPADVQKVLGAPNIYAAATQWYQRQKAQAEIGPDPAAFKAKLEAELREKLMAEFQQGNGQQVQQHQGTMPSNFAAARNVGARTGPAWAGPASIQDIFDRQKAPG